MAYVVISTIFFLIIPEIVLRVVSTDHLLRLSDFISLGGIVSPLLSLLIFLGLTSVILASLTVFVVRKIYRFVSRSDLE
ncbi:hypothetical protein ACUY4R_002130 [Kosakonia sp. BK9b]